MKFFSIVFVTISFLAACGPNSNSSVANKTGYTTQCSEAFSWGYGNQEVVYIKNASRKWDYDSYSWGLSSVRECNNLLKKCKKEHEANKVGCKVIFENLYE